MKYKLTGETKEVDGTTLYRIEALVSFRYAKAGEKGGWIESEDNLSQEGDAWVSDDAQIFGEAQVSGDSRVSSGAFY